MQLTVRHFMVAAFIGALVLANLLVTWFGPWALPITAFFMIGLDLTIRDALHEAWHGKQLVLRMGLLIGLGAVIAFILNRNAFWIGLASFCAFASAGAADVAVYSVLFKKPWMIKVNASNAAAALADSLIFTLVAFHEWMPTLVASQFAIKLGGGFMWSLILGYVRKRKRETSAQLLQVTP